MKFKRTMSRLFCDNFSRDKGTITQTTCFVQNGFTLRTDEDRDSGTESDDEGAEIEELQKYMETIIHLGSHRRPHRAPSPSRPSQLTLPCVSDGAHSSEEELEGINAGAAPTQQPQHKRKWQPLEFRASPPAHAWRPGAGIGAHELCASPRKRYRFTPTSRRPCLDFEKMQQINRVRLL